MCLIIYPMPLSVKKKNAHSEIILGSMDLSGNAVSYRTSLAASQAKALQNRVLFDVGFNTPPFRAAQLVCPLPIRR
jgi:hypothetical protein